MLHNRSSSIPLSETIIKQLESQKQQLSRIRQQQQTISSIDQNMRRKNQQISRLKSLADKFEPYHKKYTELSYEYTQKLARLGQKQKEVNMLLKQVDELIKQNEAISARFAVCDKQRTQLVREQRQIQRVNHQIEQTFKLYQQQCKKKEMGLLRDLEKAYKQITELNKRIDEYQMRVFQNEELRRKLSLKIQQQNAISQFQRKQTDKFLQQTDKYIQKNDKSIQQTERQLNFNTSKNLLQLKDQNQQLKYALAIKEQQLTKYKILNQQLSIEFDKSVSKICDFERQLTHYRQENHQLQKMLNLFVDKEKYQKMHLRQLEKVNARNLENSNMQHRYQNSANQFERSTAQRGNARVDTNQIDQMDSNKE